MQKDYIVPLTDEGDYTVSIEPTNKPKMPARYTFFKGKTIIKQLIGKLPLEQTMKTNIGQEIKSYLDPNNEYNQTKIKTDFNLIMKILDNNYITQVEAEELLIEEKRLEKQANFKNKMDKAETLLKSLDNPILYIGSVIEWMTAGERMNILYCFLAYCSQVILRNPISVIALGEAGSGKSHIELVAMSLIPDEYVVNEKNITINALFRRSEESIYFYDGKIVNYGDMGGSNDHQTMEEPKNIMKELQSEGFVCKPVSEPEEGSWNVKELHLIGTPCLTYTTVPDYNLDDQELSRSILITPRLDNQREFYRRNASLELQGKTSKYYAKMVKECENIKHIVLFLRQMMDDVEIINPYFDVVSRFLQSSKYYKRDYPKYNNLLKVITAFNYYKKTVYEDDDGNKSILVSAEDVQLFFSLISKYELGITQNISLTASDILEELSNVNPMKEGDDPEQPTLDVGQGITINEFIEKSNIHLNTKRSYQRYFTELNDAGFIKVVDKGSHNANVYAVVSDKYTPSILEHNLIISDDVKEIILFEKGEEFLTVLGEDEPVPGLSIMDHDDSVRKPPW